MKSLKEKVLEYPSLTQFALFVQFSFVALLAQVLSRILCDLLFAPLNRTVVIPPFPEQALGSFLAFAVSNIIAKALSYFMNRKKTFGAGNNLTVSIILYIVLVVALIIIETVIGTPIQNMLYRWFGGGWTGDALTTASVTDGTLYQICGTLSQMLYGIGDGLIVFAADKYVIMRKK